MAELHLRRWAAVILLIIILTASIFTSSGFALTPRPASLSQADYWTVLNKAYDGFINNYWSNEKGVYLDEGETAWMKANQAMLMFHTMRNISPYARAEDKERAQKIIAKLLSDFSYSPSVQNKYRATGTRRVFAITRQYAPGTLRVFLNGRLQKERVSYNIRNKSSFKSRKLIFFKKNPKKGGRVVFKYQQRQNFHANLSNGAYSENSHMAWNYQVAEALYYAYKYRGALSLPPAQSKAIVSTLKALASYSFNYDFAFNQDGLAWSSGILRFAHEATRNPIYAKKWRGDMKTTLNRLSRASSAGKQPDMDYDFTLNYNTSERHILAWDAQEYSHIVLRALLDIKYFRRAGIAMNKYPNFIFLLGLRQNNLGNYLLNGFPNWDSGYGRLRQFISQYWPYSLYSLKTIMLTPEFNQQKYDDRYARYLFDQAVFTFSASDMMNDPPDGAIGRDMLGVQPVLAYHYDNNKMTANADFIGQTSLLLSEFNIHNIAPLAPANIWNWAFKQQKLAVSTPNYSTSVVGATNGLYKSRYKEGMPYGGLEMTSLMTLDNTPLTMNRPGSAYSSFNFRVRDQKAKRTLLNTFNVLRGKQMLFFNKKKPLQLKKSPNGNLSNLNGYQFKRYSLSFSKLKLSGELPFNKKRFIFNNAHTFYNDGIFVEEVVRRNKKIKSGNNPVLVEKSFPASSFIEQINASTGQANDTLLYDKKSGFYQNFNNVRQLKYLHYQGNASGFMIIPQLISWGKGAKIEVGPGSIVDDYNLFGVRPVNFVIQSNKRLGKQLTFSIYITFTDGTKADAEQKYAKFMSRAKK